MKKNKEDKKRKNKKSTNDLFLLSAIEPESVEEIIKEIIKLRKKNKKTINLYINSPGGYCVIPGTKITTSKGLKNIEDIQVSDIVLTHANRWQKVLKLYKRKINENVTVIGTSNFPELKITREHPILTS